MKSFIKKIKKIDVSMDGSKDAISFYSSFLASVFVALSFVFVSFFIPYGQTNWGFNWILLSICALIYCVIYYRLGIFFMRKYPKEIRNYKINFLAALVVSIYISTIILFRSHRIVVIVSHVIVLIVVFLICYKLSHKRS